MPAPVNDNLVDARVVTGTVSYTAETTTDATYETAEGAAGYTDPSVWYRLEWPSNGKYTIAVSNASAGYYAEFRGITADPPADFSETVGLPGNNYLYETGGANSSFTPAPRAAGSVYYVLVCDAAFDGSFVASFDIAFTFTASGAAPANDNVVNAVDLLATSSEETVSGTIVNATVQSGYEDNGTNGWSSQAVWYHVQASDNGRLDVQVTKTGGAAGYVPEADVWLVPTYPPSNATAWTSLGYAGDGTATPPKTNFSVSAGQHYLISVEDYNYDSAQEGAFDLSAKLIPSPLSESWEGASIDPGIWVRRVQNAAPGDPNTGYWSQVTSQAAVGTKSLLVTPTTAYRQQLVYYDGAEGGDYDRDYWIAFAFYIADWNDLYVSDEYRLRLPAALGQATAYPSQGTGLLNEIEATNLFPDTSSTGYYRDCAGIDHYLTAGSWHELRTRYRVQSSNGKIRNTQILDGVTIVNNVEGGFWNTPRGISWTSEIVTGGSAAPLYIDPIVWSPDTDPGPLISFTEIAPPFIASTTTVYVPTLAAGNINVPAPFIGPQAVVFAPYLRGPIDVPAPFIGPTTTVFTPFLLGENPALLSQEPVEVVVFPSDQQARLTQEPVEIVVLPTDAKARLTQAGIEVVVRNVYEDVNIFFIDYQIS